jgi:hypothetical protein
MYLQLLSVYYHLLLLLLLLFLVSIGPFGVIIRVTTEVKDKKKYVLGVSKTCLRWLM